MSNIKEKLNKYFTEENIWKKNIEQWKKSYGEYNYNSLCKKFPVTINFPHHLESCQDGRYYYEVNFKTGEITEECCVVGLGQKFYENIKEQFDEQLILLLDDKK